MKKIATLTLLTLSLTAFAQDRTGWPKEIRVGILPTDQTTMDTRYGPLFDHLGKTLGVKVKPYIGADYAAIIIAMANDRLELAYYGPESYVQATKQGKVEALVASNHVKTGLGYYSALWVKASSPIKTIQDAKGKTLAFVDPNSTSGYLFPMVYLMKDQKIKPETFFSQVIFAGNHNASLLSLVNGKVDVAAVHTGAVDDAIEKKQIASGEVRQIWKSKLIPPSPIAVNGDLPESFKKAVQKAFVDLKDKNVLAGFDSKGFVAIEDSLYDPIRELEEVKQSLLKK